MPRFLEDMARVARGALLVSAKAVSERCAWTSLRDQRLSFNLLWNSSTERIVHTSCGTQPDIGLRTKASWQHVQLLNPHCSPMARSLVRGELDQRLGGAARHASREGEQLLSSLKHAGGSMLRQVADSFPCDDGMHPFPSNDADPDGISIEVPILRVRQCGMSQPVHSPNVVVIHELCRCRHHGRHHGPAPACFKHT